MPAEASIIINNSGVPAAQPEVGVIVHGELWLNWADSILYFKDESNNIQTFTASVDNIYAISNSADPTKEFGFNVAGVTTGTKRVMTIPNYDFTPATLDGTETLTLKTLTAPTINGGTINGATIKETNQTISAATGTITLPATRIFLDDDTAAAPITVTLPPAASAAGIEIMIMKTGSSFICNLVGNSGELINKEASFTFNAELESIKVYPIGNEWVITEA